MKEKIGELGWIVPKNELEDVKQHKDSKEWPEYNNQDHLLNLPLALQPTQYQIRYHRAKLIRRNVLNKIYKQKHYEKNKDKIIQRAKVWKKNNPGQAELTKAIHKATNQERIREVGLAAQKRYDAKMKGIQMKPEEPKQIKFIEIFRHHIPRGFPEIRMENLEKLQQALTTLEVKPLVLFYGNGRLLNNFLSGSVKQGHQQFFFLKDKTLYYCVEYRIRINLNGEVIK